ncbi:YaaC family protein [Bacillus badius]|uniref:YaaC family protein n=1 Tax=Bacillus badius TaxID=1455 RepID=UPI001CC06445|nr:YaaC family protein [Bacillus badius]MED0668571.1 YaaC family protein [Bacillus badius]UAT30752.1 YaaC family protein [Bacillus badius]
MNNQLLHSFDPLLPYQNTADAKSFLQASYRSIALSNAEEAAYTNCPRFLYSLEHGTTFLSQSSHSPLAIQPVLIFYGLSHYIKACLLAVDPAYPATVHVLAHGLSTRKRKKQNYSFLKDEVRTQRHGLFSHFSDKMFHVKQLEGSKLNMNDLLAQIPELDQIFSFQTREAPFHSLKKEENGCYRVTAQILDDYQMTQNRLSDFLSQKTNGSMAVEGAHENELLIRISGERPAAPCRFNARNGQWMFSRRKTPEAFYPEILIYYALLYNLSMIARYETEWWYDLLKHAPGKEFSLIKQFLHISHHKIPLVIEQYLNERGS